MKRISLLLWVVLMTTDTVAQDQLLNSVIVAVEEAASVADYERKHPMAFALLQEKLTFIKAANAGSRVLEEQKGFLAVAHARQEEVEAATRSIVFSDDIETALAEIKQVVNFPSTGLLATLADTLGEDRADEILAPLILDLQREQLIEAMARNRNILARYEKKFGPGSVQLNPVETLLNWAFQGVAGFGPDALGSPGPLEWIAAFNTGYLNYDGTDEQLQLVSGAELGLRYYIFAQGWGEGNMLRPRYASAGILIAGADDGALVLPWQGDESRYGIFAAWGPLKVAYLFGDESRVLVTRQFQIFKHVF